MVGYVVSDEGVCECGDAAGDGDEGDFGGLSGVSEVAVGGLEFRVESGCDERGRVEGGAHVGASARDGVAARREAGLRRVGREAGEADGGLAIDGAEFGHFDHQQGGDARADAGLSVAVVVAGAVIVTAGLFSQARNSESGSFSRAIAPRFALIVVCAAALLFGVHYLESGGGVPLVFVLVLAIATALWVLLTRTALGRHMYAVGGDLHAARESGVNINRVKWIGFAIAGTLAVCVGVSGPGVAGARWLADFKPRAIGSDTIPLERLPPAEAVPSLPVHSLLLVEKGIHIVEILNLEEIAHKQVSVFTFVLSPLKIVGATGVPARPLAVRARR